MDWGSVPGEVEECLRKICLALPETREQQAWNGRRWMIRNRTFAHVFCVDRGDGNEIPMMQFRSNPPELDALIHAGHPFFKAGWGHNVMAMVFDEYVDWDEVAELLADSYCTQAPKKLVERLNLLNTE